MNRLSTSPKILNGAVALCLCLALCSCGYTFSGGARPGDPVRDVFVQVLENDTSETGLETLVTNDLAREFCRGGKFRLARGESADITITGKIKSLLDENASRRSSGESARRRVKLVLSLEMRDGKGNAIWSDPDISEHETYAVVEGSVEAGRANKKAALSTAATRLAEKVRHRMEAHFEGF